MSQKALYNQIIVSVLFVVLAVIMFCSIYNVFDKKDSVDILIENATILTLNKNSEIIYVGWIAIKGEEIIDIGEGENNYKSKNIIDANGKVVMPGLVNTHTHVAMAPFRGIDDISKLSQWLLNINKYEKVLTAEDVYWSALFGEMEMIKSGTTTFNDMYFFEESIARSVQKTGMRAVVDIPFNFENDRAEIDDDFLSKFENISTINFSITPNPLVNFSEDQLKEVKRIADENNLIIHIHIGEDWQERGLFIDRYGRAPIEMLSDAGILENKIVLAHAVNFSPEEIDSLASNENVGISFNPKSNYKLLGQTASVQTMLNKGLVVGIGTDGVGSSNSLDMFDQVNFIAFTSRECLSKKEYCENESGISPERIIRMATIDGAKTLGLEKKIGSIEKGKRADLILIDFERLGLVPSYDVYASLVYNTDGSDITDSIINGKIVMEDRIIKGVDENDVINQINKIVEKINNLKD